MFKPIGEIKLHMGDGQLFAPYNAPVWKDGMQPLPGTKLYVFEEPPVPSPEVAKMASRNVWHNIRPVIDIIQKMFAGKWLWFNNSNCKYIDIRIDMRDGGCIIKDNNGTRISPEELDKQ